MYPHDSAAHPAVKPPPLDTAIKVAIEAAKRPQASRGAAPTPAYKPLPFDTVQKIADFYAGKPVSISYDVQGEGVGGFAQQGGNSIRLTPDVRTSLEALLQNARTDTGAYKGVPGLATLIHESLHTRGPATEDPVTHRTPLDPNTGLYGWDDEWQAHQLSYGLIADAVKRFFGIPFDSPLGQRYYNSARGYSYTDPVKNPFGPPETPEEIAQWGQRTLPQTNPWGWFYPWAMNPPTSP